MPMLIWVAGLSGYMHKGPPQGFEHDPAELEKRIQRPFNRERFAEIKALQRAAKVAAAKAAKLKKEKERLAAVAQAMEVQRLAQDLAWQEHVDLAPLLHLKAAVETFNKASPFSRETMRALKMMEIAAIAARQQFNDDDEAIALLMLH